MTKLLNIAVAASTLLLASCGIMGVDMTDQASVDKYLRKALEKHIDPEAVIYELDLMGIDDFSVRADISDVTYTAPNSDELETWSVSLTGGDPRKSNIVSTFIERRKKDGGLRLADIDFSQIAFNIAKGMEFLKTQEDDGEKYALDGISKYNIELNADPAKVIHTFSIESKAGSELSTKGGRLSTVTNYYEFDFKADAAGNVEYTGD